MLDAAVDDVHALYAVPRSVERRADLGKHPAGKRSVRYESVDLLRRKACQKLAVLVEHTRGIGQHHELFGLQYFCEFPGHEIGVDVVRLTVQPDADRRDDRDETALLERPDHFRVDRGDFANLADVDLFAAVVLVGEHELPRVNEGPVLTRKPDRLAA